MIVFADLHLKPESESIVFDKVLPGILEVALHDKDKAIAFLGDWWETRHRVSVRLQNRSYDWLSACNIMGIKVFMVPGNHDQIDKEGNNALKVFDAMPGVTVFTEPGTNEFGVWWPYQEGFLVPNRTRYTEDAVLWTHQDIIGGQFGNGVKSDKGCGIKDFTGWRVVSGHYHKQQLISKTYKAGTAHITYVGSPYQTRADEAGNVCGYSIWDRQAKEFKFVPTRWAPRYFSWSTTAKKLEIPEDIDDNDHVAVTVPVNDLDYVHTQLKNAGLNNFTVTPVLKAKKARLKMQAGATLGHYVVEYVKQFHGDLDQAELLLSYKEIQDAHSGN